MSTAEGNGTGPAPKTAPEWVQASLFEDLLRQHVVDYKVIKDFKAYPAMTAGENYATIMLRVEIVAELTTGGEHSISYMMKVPHDIELMREMLKMYNMFDIETDMYTEVVPELEQLYREVGLELRFGANCYKLPESTKNYVLLEDLGRRGFKNAQRLEGLDMAHTKCALKKLAQWHAASAHRVALKGLYAPVFTVGFFTELHRPIMQQMCDGSMKPFMQCVNKFAGHEQYLECLEKLQPKLVDQLYETMDGDETEFRVLNHGDCWTNNIMFQHDDEGNIKETYFVDYQISRYGTPAQDLLYFLLSSTNYDIKLKHFEYFIKYYHDNLIEHLKLLKYSKKLPTLKELHIMLYKYGIWGFWTTTTVMGAVLLEPNEDANIENFFNDNDVGNNFKILMFSNPRYRKHIEMILPWLHHRGALES